MATKTITLEIDAYEKLRAAKRGKESFTSVVRRAILPESLKTGADLVDVLKSRSALIAEEELAKIEEVDRNDAPPVNPWDES